jgi:uncharacterized protein (TIGR03067 family)
MQTWARHLHNKIAADCEGLHSGSNAVTKLLIMKLICIALAFSVSLAAFAADDAKAIEGRWLPAKAELGGKPMPAVVLKTISLKMADGRYEVMADGHPDNGTYALDTTTKPKGMTVVGTEGPNKGKTFPCIYELNGDMLRICYNLSGNKQPADFKSVVGTKLYLVTYKRQK